MSIHAEEGDSRVHFELTFQVSQTRDEARGPTQGVLWRRAAGQLSSPLWVK